MDVMLGLAPPITQSSVPQLPQIVSYDQDEINAKKSTLVQDITLNDAVSDFERTFQRSKINYQNNLPDVTAVSGKLLKLYLLLLPAISSNLWEIVKL